MRGAIALLLASLAFGQTRGIGGLGLTFAQTRVVGPSLQSTSSGIGLGASALLTNAEYNNGTCATAKTIDPSKGNRQKLTLTNAQTCALTFTQPESGTVSIQLKIVQSASGSFDGAISGGKWPGGAVPTITATSGAVDIVTCYLDGTNAYCVATQDFR